MHNGCDIANQMFSNGQLWTWPLIFEICWTRLLSLVVYIWSYLWFSFQVCSTQAVYSFTMYSLGIGTKWRQQDPRNRTIETSGTLWTDEYLQVVMTSQNVRSFRFYLWRQQDSRNRAIETSGTLWTDEYLQVVMTSQNVRSFRFYLRKGGGGEIQTHFSDKYLKYFLWNSYQVNTTPHWSLVNNGSCNGLVPSSNKPLHEPMFTQISGAIWRH